MPRKELRGAGTKLRAELSPSRPIHRRMSPYNSQFGEPKLSDSGGRASALDMHFYRLMGAMQSSFPD